MQSEKSRLRSLLLKRRRALSTLEVNDKSQCVLAQLRSFPLFLAAATVVLYSAEADEVQTEAIWHEAQRLGKAVYYPRITHDRADLEFVRREPQVALIAGTFNIPIPPGDDLLTRLQATDVVLTPGVAFDTTGRRLGRGRGYYDRAFRGPLREALRIALTFTCQVVPHVPAEETDERVHYLVTEDGLLCCLHATAEKDER